MSDEVKDRYDRIAADLANRFWLAQGFMEAPEWETLDDDVKTGFRHLAKLTTAPYRQIVQENERLVGECARLREKVRDVEAELKETRRWLPSGDGS